MSVTFAGTLNVANVFSDDMEFKILEKNQLHLQCPLDKSVPKMLCHSYLLKSRTLSPSLIIRDPMTLKVRMSGSQTWSGDISINADSGKDSFTVRIPTKNKKEFVSAVCKMYREKMNIGWRILFVFSPHFIVRSHLPRSVTLHVHTPVSNTVVQVSATTYLITKYSAFFDILLGYIYYILWDLTHLKDKSVV